MSFDQTILITSGGGHIGSRLVPRLLENRVKLILPTSNSARLQSQLPSTAGDRVVVEEGNISDPVWVASIIEKHGVDTVFLNLTGTNELMTTLNFLDVMKRSGSVKHLVYLSACGDYVSETGYRNVLAAHSAAHVLVKPVIESKIIHGGFPWTWTVLGPTLFWDNDLRSKKYIMEGFYDEPLGEKGVSRVSVDDIALAARNTLVDGRRWVGKKIMIGSKTLYTGTETARLWSEALGRSVETCPSTEEGFQKFEQSFATKTSDPAWVLDLRLMYEGFAKVAFGPTDEEYQMQVECLGKEPEDYVAFVQRTAKEWS